MDGTSLIPHDPGAEQAVLGSMLIDPECIPRTLEKLTAEDFYYPLNQDVFRLISAMSAAGQAVDPVTVRSRLTSDSCTREAAGKYIAQLMDVTITAANVGEYTEVVREKSALRAAQAAAEKTLQLVSEGANIEAVQTALQRAQEAAPQRSKANIICMADVQIESVDWLWKPYIPRGKITILQGDPGLGKTYSATRIAAIVTRGGAFPAGDDMETIEPGNVLFQTAEDGLGDTIKARLMEADADCGRVFVIDERQEGLTLDDSRLREAIQKLRPKLVVIDPIQGYLGSKLDMHRANEIRPVMARLGALAGELKCAIVLIGHQNKAASGKGIYRGIGSIDIAAAARSILAVGEVPNEKYRRAIVQVKSSLAPTGQTILFDLDPVHGFLWAGTSDLTADDVLNYRPANEREAPERDDCAAFLKDMLSDGPVPANEASDTVTAYGFSERTIDRAKKQAGIISFKDAGNGGAWYWDFKERHAKKRGGVGVLGDVTNKERQERQVRQHNLCGDVQKVIPLRGEL